MKNIDKTDRRVERTRNAIIDAFKEMIIEKIEGDFDNVMGLPMTLVKKMLDTVKI